MPLIENPTADLLNRALAFRDLRHQLIASNIANANTPGFKAFDAVLRAEIQGKPLQLERTRAGHLAPEEKLDKVGADVIRSRAPARLDGNNVSLDDELSRLLENRMMYQAAFELLDRWTGQNRTAREVR